MVNDGKGGSPTMEDVLEVLCAFLGQGCPDDTVVRIALSRKSEAPTVAISGTDYRLVGMYVNKEEPK